MDASTFDHKFWDSDNRISKMGRGAIGGKAEGLLSILKPLACYMGTNKGREIRASIPRTTVISTDFFDAFMQHNDLYAVALSDKPDDRIAAEFQKGTLPPRLEADLRCIAEKVRTPLAVRSSSLIEDSLSEPHAGVFRTKMTPNNQPDVESRFSKLVEAVKYVWASTYFRDAKQYFRSLRRPLENEKMAVIIQDVVGKRHQDRFYPHISGVARSYNYYPWGNNRAEYGIVDLALGMGKTIVDGGRVWSYCPVRPRTLPPFRNTEDMFQNTQTKFWAVNMGKIAQYDPTKEIEFMTRATLDDAEHDNAINMAASTYDRQFDRVVPGIARSGPRILDFAPILKYDKIPLNRVITEVLAICERQFNTGVEIEFAVVFDEDCRCTNFSLVQVRPLVVPSKAINLVEKNLEHPMSIVSSTYAIGNGKRDDIRDIVFFDPDVFEVKRSQMIAKDLAVVNDSLGAESRPYLLIGFGRFGTSDPWGGVPVSWRQICHARCIVEVSLPTLGFEFSQGSHFFHNVTNLNVGYLNVEGSGPDRVDWSWLQSQNIVHQSAFVTHVRLEEPLCVYIDGKKNWGVIMKHGGAPIDLAYG